MNYIGELASLFTSLCFTGSSVFFTLSGQKVGSAAVNRVRVAVALVFLLAWNWILFGKPLPLDADPRRWFWFALSGAIGYAIGDAFLFQAFVCIGAQKGMLMMSLAPLLSAVLAWVFFGEVLTGGQILGILVTLLGIAWVILRRNPNPGPSVCKPFQGVWFGLGAAAGQAVGFVLSKQGLEGGFSPVAGNAIRMLAAAAILWGLLLARGEAGQTARTVRAHPRIFGLVVLGAFLGPVLGVSSSLFALHYTQVGVASTLTALPPVFLLPVGWLVFKDKVDWQSIAGTLVAIGGVAMLFLA
ncbi:MAG: DMT family transporter [Chloroflexota bacterium]